MIDLLTVERQWQELASESLSGAVLPAHPFQLVTLWDMLRFEAHWFYRSLGFLNLCLHDASQGMRDETRGGRHAYPTDDELKRLESTLNSLLQDCDRLGLIRAQERIRKVKFDLDNRATYSYVTLKTIHRKILETKQALDSDLTEHIFMSLRTADVKYFEQEKLFGPEVFTNFASTRSDVQSAGNCYATGNYTACVFHCMRVLEKGLHALVRDLNTRFATNIVFNKDIEFINWGNIIQKTETEINKLLNPKSGPVLLQEDLKFLSQTVMEFSYFKTAWRDDVSHARSNYDENEALAVMNHVDAFMRKIAAKLSE